MDIKVEYKRLIIITTLIIVGWFHLSGQVPANPINNYYLKDVYGKIHPQIEWYSGTQPDSVKVFSGDYIKTESSEWLCTMTADQSNQEGELDLLVTFKLTKGNESSAAAVVSYQPVFIMVTGTGQLGMGTIPLIRRICIIILTYR
jgi:hypothetical protein